MSNKHKNLTINFRITDAERKQIEARILTSGMIKKDYFVHSCIYNRVCIVGKKETIYPLVHRSANNWTKHAECFFECAGQKTQA